MEHVNFMLTTAHSNSRASLSGKVKKNNHEVPDEYYCAENEDPNPCFYAIVLTWRIFRNSAATPLLLKNCL